jgi:Holliday junction resolvase RusA-like endonuclease
MIDCVSGVPQSSTEARTMQFTFDVPAPPSTNHLFRNVPGRGRVVTAEYEAWRRTAAIEAGHLPWYGEDKKNRYRWEVQIALHHFPHTRDVDNATKPLIDFVAAHTGLRDNYCEVVTVFRSAMEDGAQRATVTVTLLSWPALTAAD